MFSLISCFLSLVFLGAVLFKECWSSYRFAQRKNGLLKEIAYHLSLEKWDLAEKKILILLARKDCRHRVLLSYARVLRNTRRFEEALLTVEEGLKGNGEEENLFSLEKALCLEALKQYDKALPLFYKTRDFFSRTEDFVACAKTLLMLGKPEKAKQILNCTKANLMSFEQKFLMGNVCFALNSYEEALVLFQEAARLSLRFSSDLYKKIGHCYKELALYEEAKKVFQFLIKQNPCDFENLFALGLCEEQQGRYKEALLIYQQSSLWKKHDPVLMKHGGKCAFFIQEYVLAKECLAKLLTVNSPAYQDSLIWVKYAACLEALRESKQAERIYMSIIKKFPGCVEGYRALSWMYGVGVSTYMTSKEGLLYAQLSVQIRKDQISLEVLSACEARAGNFKRAYKIQSLLISYDTSKEEQKRRQRLLRNLRQNLPLDNEHLNRIKVSLAA